MTEAGLQGLKEGRDGEGRAHPVDQQTQPRGVILRLRMGALARNRSPEPPAWLQVTPMEGCWPLFPSQAGRGRGPGGPKPGAAAQRQQRPGVTWEDGVAHCPSDLTEVGVGSQETKKEVGSSR